MDSLLVLFAACWAVPGNDLSQITNTKVANFEMNHCTGLHLTLLSVRYFQNLLCQLGYCSTFVASTRVQSWVVCLYCQWLCDCCAGNGTEQHVILIKRPLLNGPLLSTSSRGPVKALQSKFISEVVNLLISVRESTVGAGAVLFRRCINKNKGSHKIGTVHDWMSLSRSSILSNLASQGLILLVKLYRQTALSSIKMSFSMFSFACSGLCSFLLKLWSTGTLTINNQRKQLMSGQFYTLYIWKMTKLANMALLSISYMSIYTP